MPLTSSIVHPRMLGYLSNFFRQTAAITYRDPAATPDAYGQLPAPSALSGHSAIACSLQRSETRSDEKRYDKTTVAATNYAALLDGYYPAIQARMICTIGGIVYDIQTVVHHSQVEYTQLELELTQP